MGYNGPPAGAPHCDGKSSDQCATCQHFDQERLVCRGSIHAEMNVIAFAAKAGISTEGATLYCRYSPCYDCAKVIINCGIVRFVFAEFYHDLSGSELLRQSGIVQHAYKDGRLYSLEGHLINYEVI